MPATESKIDCPKCGCYDVTNVRDATWDAAILVHVCNHCRHKFESDATEAADRERFAIYQQTHCPFCNSAETSVTQGPRPGKHGEKNVRRHKCTSCSMPFSSREL